MSHSYLTQWIEDADARRFAEEVEFERSPTSGETHYLHLGDAIAHLPRWFRREVSREPLAAIACQPLAYLRPAHDRKDHYASEV
jgi:hypothetical protein